ncbi:MAG: flagellar hook-length control protein FliK, partial [Rubrobacteridae bacterium]|nr:flagellar hook-length control protein FliK [Rubrobacteridae bacterium]
MNIFQLAIAVETNNVQSVKTSQKPQDNQEESFRSVFNDALDRISGSVTPTINDNDSIERTDSFKTSSDMGTDSVKPESSKENAEYSEKAGEYAASLASTVLGEASITGNDKALESILKAILQQIDNVEDEVGLKNLLLSGLQNIEDGKQIAGSLQEKLVSILAGLSDELKSKFPDAGADKNVSISIDELEAISLAISSMMQIDLNQEAVTTVQDVSDAPKATNIPVSIIDMPGVEIVGEPQNNNNDVNSGKNTQRISAEGVDTETEASGLEIVANPDESKSDSTESVRLSTKGTEHTDSKEAISSELLGSEIDGDLNKIKAVAQDISTGNLVDDEEKHVASPSIAGSESTTQSNNSELSGNQTSESKDPQPRFNDAAIKSYSAHTVNQQDANSAQAAVTQATSFVKPENVDAQFKGIVQAFGQEHVFVQTDKLLSNIAGKLDLLLSEGRSEAKIKLKPDFLGDLKIHLVMDGGSMKAVLTASTNQAKDLIEANLSALKQSLESQGLQLKEFEVTVDQQQSYQDNKPFKQHYHSRSFADTQLMDVAVNEQSRLRDYAVLNGSMAVN